MAEENMIRPDFEGNERAGFITVDDGSIVVPIRNRQGDEIGRFSFRPTDMGIIDRYNKFVSDFDRVIEPLEQVDIKNDGTVDETDEAAVTAMREAQERLFSACDELFGGNMSEAFFGKMHPFSPIGGHFYCENAINAAGQYISKEFNREVKKVRSRVEKYTHGYSARTGKHRNGKA